MSAGIFSLEDFLKGRERKGTIQVPGAPPIGVRELKALERFKLLSKHEEEHLAIIDMEQDAILAAERIKAGKETIEDSLLVARYNSIAIPYYADLISAITVDPHLEAQEVIQLMEALDTKELQDFITQSSRYFVGPNLEELKKKHGGQN